jgi:hypothetical protein
MEQRGNAYGGNVYICNKTHKNAHLPSRFVDRGKTKGVYFLFGSPDTKCGSFLRRKK